MEMRTTSSTDVSLCFAAAQSGTTTYQHTSERGEKDLHHGAMNARGADILPCKPFGETKAPHRRSPLTQPYSAPATGSFNCRQPRPRTQYQMDGSRTCSTSAPGDAAASAEHAAPAQQYLVRNQLGILLSANCVT